MTKSCTSTFIYLLLVANSYLKSFCLVFVLKLLYFPEKESELLKEEFFFENFINEDEPGFVQIFLTRPPVSIVFCLCFVIAYSKLKLVSNLITEINHRIWDFSPWYQMHMEFVYFQLFRSFVVAAIRLQSCICLFCILGPTWIGFQNENYFLFFFYFATHISS